MLLLLAKDMCKLAESLLTCRADLVSEKTDRLDRVVDALLLNKPVLIPYLCSVGW